MELQVFNISKSFSKKIVVNEINLSMNSGETLGLLGPNGAGKTTLFYLIAGLVKPDKGKILINKIDVTEDDISIRSKKGLTYLPQESSIFKNLTVKDNILAALENKEDLNKSTIHSELSKLLDELSLLKLQSNKGATLSGGERRRVEIARALAMQPHFLLLDEPFAGIDPIAVAELKNLITQLNSKDIGVLISDHNVRETMQICKKVIILSEGKIIAEGTPKEVSKDKLVKKIYLGNDFVSEE
jgi:lipopolysaccharide export system ATP-binding protein